MVSPASSLIAAASRSASRRLLTKISVERCARMSSTSRGWIAVQIEARPVAEAGPLASSRLVRAATCPRLALRSRVSAAASRRHRQSSPGGIAATGGGPTRTLRGCRAGPRPRRSGVAWPRATIRSRRRRPCRRTTRCRRGTGRLRRAGAASRTSPIRCTPPAAQRLQPLERKRQVRPPLGRHQGVDLVNDDRLERSQHVARVRGEQQVQRFGRGDQQIRRLALESGPVRGGRVARANRHRRHGHRHARRRGGLGDADERRAQIALDVDGERLERRDVEDAAALPFGRRRLKHQPVQAPEKRRQRLARSGGRQNQRRCAAGDGGPAGLLRGCRAAGKTASNHARTGGSNGCRASRAADIFRWYRERLFRFGQRFLRQNPEERIELDLSRARRQLQLERR